MPQPNENDDLQWLAFCYIADELDEDQRADFEIRLAADQVAREMVASAMEQSQVLYAALETSGWQGSKTSGAACLPSFSNSTARRPANRATSEIPDANSKRRLISPGMLAAAASLLLLCASWSWFSQSSWRNDNLSQSAQLDGSTVTRAVEPGAGIEEQLALAWADTLVKSDNDFSNIAGVLEDEVDRNYTNVVFEDDSWLVDALVEFDDESTWQNSAEETELDLDIETRNHQKE